MSAGGKMKIIDIQKRGRATKTETSIYHSDPEAATLAPQGTINEQFQHNERMQPQTEEAEIPRQNKNKSFQDEPNTSKLGTTGEFLNNNNNNIIQQEASFG